MPYTDYAEINFSSLDFSSYVGVAMYNYATLLWVYTLLLETTPIFPMNLDYDELKVNGRHYDNIQDYLTRAMTNNEMNYLLIQW